MKKRVLSFLLAFLVILSFPLQCLTSFAGSPGKLCLHEPYDTIRFDSYVSSWNFKYDYYLLVTYHDFDASTGEVLDDYYYLYCFNDYYGHGKLYISTGSEPQYTRLYIGEHNENNITTRYSIFNGSDACFLFYLLPYTDKLSDNSSYCRDWSANYFSDFRFDFLHNDTFPYYHSSEVNGTLHKTTGILASNVDIYDYNGNLLQYGNYYTLLQYFNNMISPDLITDYSGHETAAGVEATEPTEPTHDDDYIEDSVQVSNNILTNIKNIFKSLAELPQKIGDLILGGLTELGEFLQGCLESLGNSILEGLKFLFVPSDNLFIDIIDMIKSRFGFIDQIRELTDFLIHYDFDESPPDSSVQFKNSDNLNWGRFTSQIMDWDLIEPYRHLIRNLVLAVSWYFFLRKLHKRIPDIINGVSSGGDSQ